MTRMRRGEVITSLIELISSQKSGRRVKKSDKQKTKGGENLTLVQRLGITDKYLN